MAKYLKLLCFLLFTVSFAAESRSDTFTVTNLNDSGPGSLRQAIEDANNSGGEDDIVFQGGLSGTIPSDVAFSGQMDITDDVNIIGPGADVVTINAQQNGRIFNIDDMSDSVLVVSISGLRLINGLSGSFGGAIFNNDENVSIDSCVFENNQGDDGGAIFSAVNSTLSITDSDFLGNRSEDNGGAIFMDNRSTVERIRNSRFIENRALGSSNGGAIFFNVSMVIEEISTSTFRGNESGRQGGAIFINNSTTVRELSQSTFNENRVLEEFSTGGAIFINASVVIEQLFNSTFYDNSAMGDGGAIFNWSGQANMSFVTITNNTAGVRGGGLALRTQTPVPLNIRNSIVAFNNSPGGANCAEDTNNLGFNYSDDSSCGFGPGDDSFIELGELFNNGGPTETVELIGGAPLDGASPGCDSLGPGGQPSGSALDIDQRFFPRPSPPGGICDSGAFETQISVIILSPLTSTNEIRSSQTVTATVTNRGEPLSGVLVSFGVLSGPNAGEVNEPNNGECSLNDDCTTDQNGEVSWTYTGGRFAGTDRILASFFDEEFEETMESNEVTVIWLGPVRNIPTLSEWGMIFMAGFILLAGVYYLRWRRSYT